MKLIPASAALAAAMFLPAAFAQAPPPATDPVQADAERHMTELVTAKTNGEPVAADVAAVVESGKSYTTDDLVRAQRVAMHLDAGPSNPAARTPENTTKTPGQTAVFDGMISTDKGSSITASATDARIPSQPATPATAQNDVRPTPTSPDDAKAAPPVDQPDAIKPLSTPDTDVPQPAPRPEN